MNGTSSFLKQQQHFSSNDGHYQKTFKWYSGRGSETFIKKVSPEYHKKPPEKHIYFHSSEIKIHLFVRLKTGAVHQAMVMYVSYLPWIPA